MRKLAKWQRFCWRCGWQFGENELRRVDSDTKGRPARTCEPCWLAAHPEEVAAD